MTGKTAPTRRCRAGRGGCGCGCRRWASRLGVLAATLGPVPRVLLRDTDPVTGPGRMVRPGSAEMPAPGTRSSADRLQLLGEVARGGMGAILKGRDIDLGRDLAIKVLLEQHLKSPELIRRFVEEAQIAGQLQHPGIVPIYELGVMADRRPYIAMKLVKGQTLASLLDERSSARFDRTRLLAIFEQVCLTMAYAHARGVIHRDLKPSNVMVGSFGEVQVMDWGLAKVLPQGGVSDDATAGRVAHETVIQTARSGGNADASLAGSIMGTPAYMPPEQAGGAVERLDERADVFALGSMLCEILSGRPAYTGRSSAEIQRKAALGNLGEAFGRLDAAEVDAELSALAKECLASEPEDRPRDAGVVAGRLRTYLASLDERMNQARLAEAAASARAEEAKQTAAAAEGRARAERRARWLTAGLAAAVLALGGLGAGGYTWVENQRAGRRTTTARAVHAALEQAVRLQGEARAAAGRDVSRWVAALAQVERTDDLVKQGDADAPLRGQVEAVRGDIRAAAPRPRTRRDGWRPTGPCSKAWRACAAGWPTTGTGSGPTPATPPRSARRGSTSMRPSRSRPGRGSPRGTVPVELAGYLDHWAHVRRETNAPPASWQRLVAAARAADPDPWRDKLRAHVAHRDPAAAEVFCKLADDPATLEAQPTASVLLLALQLKDLLNDRARPNAC